jgi:hypothetical protein
MGWFTARPEYFLAPRAPAGSRLLVHSPALAVVAIVWLASTAIISNLVNRNALDPRHSKVK